MAYKAMTPAATPKIVPTVGPTPQSSRSSDAACEGQYLSSIGNEHVD